MQNLAQRVQAVRLLLESLHDPYPTPQGALRPDSGPAASRYLPCETCRSTGRVRARGGYVVCLICDGRGERRRERDDPEWDAYLCLPLEEAAQLPREPEPPRLALSPEEEADSYGWERSRALHDRRGSYRELRRQLAWLAQTHPRRFALVHAILVEHEQRDFGPRALVEMELGVVSIALRMRRVRVPAWLREERSLKRRETIGTLAAAGLKAGEIARALGIPKRVVIRRLKTLDSQRAGVPARAT